MWLVLKPKGHNAVLQWVLKSLLLSYWWEPCELGIATHNHQRPCSVFLVLLTTNLLCGSWIVSEIKTKWVVLTKCWTFVLQSQINKNLYLLSRLWITWNLQRKKVLIQWRLGWTASPTSTLSFTSKSSFKINHYPCLLLTGNLSQISYYLCFAGNISRSPIHTFSRTEEENLYIINWIKILSLRWWVWIMF